MSVVDSLRATLEISNPMLAITATALIAIAAYWLLHYGVDKELNRYPGPFLAKYTKLWHRLSVKSNKHQHHLLDLHRRHGSIVRIGPKTLSLAEPDLIPFIYGFKRELPKVLRWPKDLDTVGF